jgi:hypothetical protein
VGIGIAVTRKKDPHPALGGGPRPGAAPPHANPSGFESFPRHHQRWALPAWVKEGGISYAERGLRINETLDLAIKMNDSDGDAIVAQIWQMFPLQIIRSPKFAKFSHLAASRL